jgi:hypothetical protein
MSREAIGSDFLLMFNVRHLSHQRKTTNRFPLHNSKTKNMMIENKEKKIRRALCVVISLIWSGVCFGVELYVAPAGSDKNPGTKEKPLLTLEGARDLIRAARKRNAVPSGGVTVFLRGGTHVRTSTFAMTKEDSGRPDSPVTYSSFPGEKAVLIGGVRLDASKAVAVKDTEVLARIPETARSKVRVLDLAAAGVEGIQPPGLSGSSMGGLHRLTRHKIGATQSGHLDARRRHPGLQ